MVLLQSNSKKLTKGDKAEEFSLKNVDNEVINLKDFEGKAIVIIFMCNHCPYVIPKLNEITQLQEDMEGIICINSNDPTKYPQDNFENMQKLAKEKRIKYYLFDETQETAKKYGAVCTPDIFVFNQEHKLVYHGRINNAMEPEETPTKHDLKEVIIKMKTGKNIEEWFKPSQGCSIKWRE